MEAKLHKPTSFNKKIGPQVHPSLAALTGYEWMRENPA